MFMHTVNDAEFGLCYVDWGSTKSMTDMLGPLPTSICNVNMSDNEIIFKAFMAFVVCVVPLSILGFIYFKIYRHATLSKK